MFKARPLADGFLTELKDAELFLISRADGFFPPTFIRDELYAQTQRQPAFSRNSSRSPRTSKATRCNG